MFEPSRYKVTGTQPVLGHAPGSTFEDDLEPDLEARMLARGSLTKLEPPRRQTAPKPPAPPKDAEAAADHSEAAEAATDGPGEADEPHEQGKEQVDG
jgi:hypothetical protein